MTGLIWFVQVVHYPLMARVGDEMAVIYAAAHQRRTTLIVAPVMLVEVAAAAAASLTISLSAMAGPDAWMVHAAGALLVPIWASTVWLQMPLHARLLNGPDVGVVRALVRTNWIRTWCWTARSALLTASIAG
ncbi:MAG: hypothetical protein ACTS22_03880 [Phycisphaerales bacterium]